jgi:hypothetical protein
VIHEGQEVHEGPSHVEPAPEAPAESTTEEAPSA